MSAIYRADCTFSMIRSIMIRVLGSDLGHFRARRRRSRQFGLRFRESLNIISNVFLFFARDLEYSVLFATGLELFCVRRKPSQMFSSSSHTISIVFAFVVFDLKQTRIHRTRSRPFSRLPDSWPRVHSRSQESVQIATTKSVILARAQVKASANAAVVSTDFGRAPSGATKHVRRAPKMAGSGM